jgi:hypothetical protein
MTADRLMEGVGSQVQDELVGRVIGDGYVLQVLVAQGAGVRKYRAEDRRGDGHVAVWILLDCQPADLDRARTYGSVAHDGLVRLRDAKLNPDSSLWLIMDWSSSVTVRDWLERVRRERQSVPTWWGAEVLRQVSSALAAVERAQLSGLVMGPESIAVDTEEAQAGSGVGLRFVIGDGAAVAHFHEGAAQRFTLAGSGPRGDLARLGEQVSALLQPFGAPGSLAAPSRPRWLRRLLAQLAGGQPSLGPRQVERIVVSASTRSAWLFRAVMLGVAVVGIVTWCARLGASAGG